MNLIILLLIIFMTLLGSNNYIKSAKWSIIITIPYQIVSLAIFVYSIIYKYDSFLYLSLGMLFVFPCFYLGWSNNDNYSFLFDYFAISFSIVCFIYYIGCFHFAYHGTLYFYDGRAMAHTKAPNLLAYIGMMNGISTLYLANKYYKNKIALLIISILFGPSLVFVELASSRAAFACILTSIICFVIYNLKVINKNIIKKQIIKILVILIMFFSTYYLFSLSKDYLVNEQKIKSEEIRQNILKDEENKRQEELKIATSENEKIEELPEKYFIAKIGIEEGINIEVNRIYSKYNVEYGPIIGLLTPLYSGDVLTINVSLENENNEYYPVYSVENAKYIDDKTYIVDNQDVTITTGIKLFEEKNKEEKTKKQEAENKYNNSLKERNQKVNSSIEKFFAGRIKLWKLFLSKVSYKGNDYNNLTVSEFNNINFEEVTRPHNIYLEVAYRFGLQFGIIHLFWIVTCCIKSFLLLIRRKYNNDNYLFIIIASAAFFIESIIEQNIILTDIEITLVFYLCIAPLMVKTIKK